MSMSNLDEPNTERGEVPKTMSSSNFALLALGAIVIAGNIVSWSITQSAVSDADRLASRKVALEREIVTLDRRLSTLNDEWFRLSEEYSERMRDLAKVKAASYRVFAVDRAPIATPKNQWEIFNNVQLEIVRSERGREMEVIFRATYSNGGWSSQFDFIYLRFSVNDRKMLVQVTPRTLDGRVRSTQLTRGKIQDEPVTGRYSATAGTLTALTDVEFANLKAEIVVPQQTWTSFDKHESNSPKEVQEMSVEIPRASKS